MIVPPRKPGENNPLHQRVAETLRRDLLRGLHPGVKLDSEARLAKRLGVSELTLRQALSVLAFEGLIERRHGSGTFVAEPGRRKAVAVATSTYSGQPPNSFQLRLVLSLSELFRRQGYRCRLYIAPAGAAGGWDELIEDVEAGRVAGAVFVAMDAGSVPIPLAENNVPHLQWDGSSGSVGLDYVDLVRRGVTHLLERGCRRIGLMQWTGDMPYKEATYQAFRCALVEHGLPVHEPWIRRLVPPEVPGAGWEQFRDIWSARAEKPDGLLVTDDLLFRDVAMAILDSHIAVPQQLQVVVHANKGSGLTYPFPVSRLEVDLDEWAAAMMRRLVALMSHEPISQAVQYIRARLIPAGENQVGPVRGVTQLGPNFETAAK